MSRISRRNMYNFGKGYRTTNAVRRRTEVEKREERMAVLVTPEHAHWVHFLFESADLVGSRLSSSHILQCPTSVLGHQVAQIGVPTEDSPSDFFCRRELVPTANRVPSNSMLFGPRTPGRPIPGRSRLIGTIVARRF
ncbi:hypothetical protein LSTR_LSTR015157 [Laodelphax striatellus]|uniref:Uncharacterized protein n=1 Tax=Laodelphax striatellus TaxID=195883 RepID=A0A482XF74_LAOST|nr:hypothetical protein LSTR_LSTR015157 [Laodelphax striatellus]